MIKDNLRALREERGASQKDIADGVGVSLQRYNHYETGKREPGEAMLRRIAAYYGIPVWCLYRDAEEKTTDNCKCDSERGFESIGKNIRNARKAAGLTQKALGELCDPPIAEPTIRRYELGKLNPKIETVRKIAYALNVDPEELYNGDDSNKIHIACEKNQDVNIGENIRTARIRRGLSQEELANKVNAATITIRQYESGKRQPRYEALQNIANALNVKTSELIGEGSDAEARMTVWFDVGKDDELIKHLESIQNVNGYLKALIRADIAISKAKE